MIFAAAVFIAAGATLVPVQTADAPRPLVRLLQDLGAATTHAQLTDSQRSALQADCVILENARHAREQGATVDRRQVATALNSIRQTMDSGAFTAEDKQTINADVDVLRKQ